MSRGLDVGFVPGIDPQPRGGSSAPARNLIARRFFYASGTDTVPAGAKRAVVRAVGQGGTPVINGGAGGGGAYARSDIACAPGLVATITVGAQKVSIAGASPPDGSNGVATSVTLNDTSVVAAGGRGGNFGSGAPGGLVANSTGTIRRAGGAASPDANTDASPGTNGGAGGKFISTSNGNTPGGGGAAGDVGDADSLGIASAGAGALLNAGPGGGGAYYGTWGNVTVHYTPSGMAVIEYWSA